MKFEARYPNHPLLKKYIQYYYFVKTDSPAHYSRYYSFPNTTMPVNIHRNVTVSIEKEKVQIRESAAAGITAIVNGMREAPLQVEWNGNIDKLTIAFKPAGLNAFINEPLQHAVRGFTNIFTGWDSLPEYQVFLQKLYTTADINKRTQTTEDFLLDICRPYEKEPLLYTAIDILGDFTNEKTISETAAVLNIAERSFNRLFKNYVGIAPVGYRKIARFRQSLENKVIKEKFKRLTDISYESNYYDQAYYIKMYKKLTGKSPKNLYKAIAKLADDNVIFEFLEKTIDFG
ncbi:helix-turn-helix domain-containing protein [Niabella beijingensis]|uniref:helix-turn-helix domain-containing protein n=1 Tax=Niabella beijingensis TaxID=2872700 RepID=UPI001CBFF802|nr:AraC family transcriptional regulator [Niabella beijingensis]MBZ4191132.1 AraC family transcriptional regulator [Niabella beijingensis]